MVPEFDTIFKQDSYAVPEFDTIFKWDSYAVPEFDTVFKEIHTRSQNLIQYLNQILSF